MATLDGTDEPLFADDLDSYSDEDPPPLPPRVVPRPRDGGAPVVDTDMGAGSGYQPPTTQPDQTTPTGRKRGQDANEEGGGENDEPPKKIRKPLVTLKMDRLFSEDGFPYLVKEFPKFKFKGKGGEGKDLKLLLKQYEEWANGLFPKLTFRDFCQRIEALAKKNEFRSRVNNIRRGSTDMIEDDNLNEEAGLTSNVIRERLSPELEDSVTTATNDANQTTPLITNTPPASSQTGLGGVVNEVPDPWDVIVEEQEEDPYEDFPDL